MKWSEFVRDKFHEEKKLAGHLKRRLEDGRGSTTSLDLDLYPLISEWNSTPWTYTVPSSCSGTPEEHGVFPHNVNGLSDNPHACFRAYSYIPHPMFPLFNSWITNSIRQAIDLSGDSKDKRGDTYLHAFDIVIPQEVILRNDRSYLSRFWNSLKHNIIEFKFNCNAKSEHTQFECKLPQLERRFIRLIHEIDKPILVTTQDKKEYMAILTDVFPYSSIAVCLREGQMPGYFSLGEDVEPEKRVTRVESWLGEELFNQDWMQNPQR